jgi:release factor glutamine methyltransferase
VARRLTGEPLAWITGAITFCGIRVDVDPGVFVPRPHTEQLAQRATECLPHEGTAIDLCTGSGAVAKVLMSKRSGARVLASDIDERAVACAARNGVEVHRGDLLAPFLSEFEGRVDVVVGSPPYVPTSELGLLQRDTFVFESALAYDGGPDGTTFLRRAIADANRLLRNGGTLLLELGGGQAGLLHEQLSGHGYRKLRWLRDEDGDLRGLEAKLMPRSGVWMPNERGC